MAAKKSASRPLQAVYMLFNRRKQNQNQPHASHTLNESPTIHRSRDMASTSSAIGGTKATITLEPSDIPGAALEEPFEVHAMPALRWWLLCRGIKAPVSWKKKQLITR